MNVTMTGRPRYAASETGAPFWSVRLISGARSFPAAHVAAGYQRAIFLWPYSAAAVTHTLKELASS